MTTSLEVNAIRSCFAIICVTVLSILATYQGMNGELIKFALMIIGVLGGAEVLLEYYYGRQKNGGG